MNKDQLTSEATPTSANGPYMMLGAGQLCAAVDKEGDELGGWKYHSNVFRMDTSSGIVEQRFAPGDITDFVKLARVLAYAIADDGCLSRDLKDDLCRLSACLDEVLSTDWHS